MIFRKAALEREIVGIFESPKDAIPPGDVTVVKAVNAKFMMDGVMLRALKKIANPARCAQIAVIEVFAKGGINVEPESSFDGSAENEINEHDTKERVRRDFQRMFVEGCEDFDATRAMVNLMTYAPKKVGAVTHAVPPVEDECPDEPGKKAFERRILNGRNMKQRF